MDKGEQRIRDAARMEPIIGVDTPCRGCGYNLKGLEVSAKCPECGRPSRRRRKVSQADCVMTAAPKGWLQVYALGITIAFIAWPAMIGGTIMRCFTSSREMAIFSFAAGCAWWLGVVIATRPRPEMPDMTTSPMREWFWRRAMARILSAAVAIPLGVLIATSEGSGPVQGLTVGNLWALADFGLFVASMGFVAFAFYMFELAHWAGDWQASNKWRAAGVGMVICTVLVIFGRNIRITEGITTGLMALPGVVLLFLMLTTAVGVPVAFAFWTIMQQRDAAVWAIKNHDDAVDKVDRDRAKLQRELEESIEAGPADIVPHIDLPSYSGAKKARYNPKTMTPGPAPKPIKFSDMDDETGLLAGESYGIDPEGTPAPAPLPANATQRTRRTPGMLYNPKTMTPGPAPKRITDFDMRDPPPQSAADEPPLPMDGGGGGGDDRPLPMDSGDEPAFDLSPEPDKPA